MKCTDGEMPQICRQQKTKPTLPTSGQIVIKEEETNF